ncbi:IND1(iron-sulfur protein required for NADH dehydrogenase)-like isoform 1 [Hibiscus syriacus]|uniref:IND1(Iron-sulfur protein required for NADH dehydrogenase)-like isoform 1 n=1 Tax=Hibiscus syriacus TaxID=106335 RepID=A0A6A2Z505_HIBSY|nr:myosin-binding protein 1-like [Hibiscus syriacus]KAE8686175.1 IND1(iron-sulfur protein required for NADH dehydrogenase)-like isoform 1 [Hibiscus syriacus]
MTATGASSFPGLHRNLKRFIRVLNYAACEWILIFLLFVDAAFSYMLTSFARHCELQIPCIICSRLDHVFGKVKDGYYRTLFCRNHRSKLSFLLSCNIHDKLVDGRGMCDDCLSSRFEGIESNSDMQRLFAGKLGYEGNCGSRSSVLNQGIRLCLCCGKPWVSRAGSHGMADANRNIPFPCTLSPSELKKMSNKCCASAASHVGDTELKITSKSKSRFRSADNHDGNRKVCDLNEKEPKRQLNAIESRGVNVSCLAPERENKEKANSNGLPELISLDASSGLMEPSFNSSSLPDFVSLVDTSNSVKAKIVPLEKNSDNCDSASSKTENISVNNNNETMKVMNTSTGARFETGRVVNDTSRLNSTDRDRTAPEFVSKCMLACTNGANGDRKSSPATKIEHISLSKNGEISKLISNETRTGLENDQVVDDATTVKSTDGDPSLVPMLPVSGEEKSASEFAAENNVVNEDLKSLPAQNSSGEGNPLSLNYLSPELQDRAVQLLRTDSISVEVRNLQNLFIEAISESPGLEPFDESRVIEGESLVDTLNRQVEDAREYIDALSKELDEERNASAIAANQAMAMITRLQEEKASLRMEALQYLRMMEQQAEYDSDALEKANDLLTDKEKELQDLEAELDYYRLNFPHEIPEEAEPHVPTVHTTTCSEQNDMKSNTIEPEFPEACVVDDQPVVITAWSEIKDEKSFISQLLQKLEKKLSRLAQYGAPQENSNSEHSDDEKDHKQEHNASSKANRTGPSRESSSTSTRKDEVVSKENGETVSDGEDCIGNGLEDLEIEIAELHERLEALEADCSFLHRSFNYIKNGKEGLVLIQEILLLLREVKEIGLKTLNSSVL